MPSLTFVASFQAISATGAVPVACDIYPDTLLMDTDDVRRRITTRTKAVMPVHYASNPCNMDALMEIAKEHNLRIVEDAAHAFGSYYKGKKIEHRKGGAKDGADAVAGAVHNCMIEEGWGSMETWVGGDSGRIGKDAK